MRRSFGLLFLDTRRKGDDWIRKWSKKRDRLKKQEDENFSCSEDSRSRSRTKHSLYQYGLPYDNCLIGQPFHLNQSGKQENIEREISRERQRVNTESERPARAPGVSEAPTTIPSYHQGVKTADHSQPRSFLVEQKEQCHLERGKRSRIFAGYRSVVPLDYCF